MVATSTQTLAFLVQGAVQALERITPSSQGCLDNISHLRCSLLHLVEELDSFRVLQSPSASVIAQTARLQIHLTVLFPIC